jgi:hypothetical protein
VQATQARMAKGDYAYEDDDLIFLPGGNAVIAHAAPKLVPEMISTKKPTKLHQERWQRWSRRSSPA